MLADNMILQLKQTSGLCQKILRSNKYFQKNNRIKNEHTKIIYLPQMKSRNSGNQPHLQQLQKIKKVPEISLTRKLKTFTMKTLKHIKKLKQILGDRPLMLINQEKQNYENGYIAECDLHIEYRPHQNPSGILQSLQINLKIHMESQKILNNEDDPEQSNYCCWDHSVLFQMIPHSHH